MAGRKQKRALGNGLESLFGPEGSSGGPERTIPAASGGQGGIFAIILVAFVIGALVEFFFV